MLKLQKNETKKKTKEKNPGKHADISTGLNSYVLCKYCNKLVETYSLHIEVYDVVH